MTNNCTDRLDQALADLGQISSTLNADLNRAALLKLPPERVGQILDAIDSIRRLTNDIVFARDASKDQP